MAQTKDFYQKAEEAIVNSLSPKPENQTSSLSTAASSTLSFDSLGEEDHLHAKKAFRNKTEQLKDHSKQRDGSGKGSQEFRRGRKDRSPIKRRGSPAKRRSTSRTRRRSTSRPRSSSPRKQKHPSSPVGKSPRSKPKSYRNERPMNSEKNRQQSSRKLQQPQLPLTLPYAHSIPPVLPPPDLTSSTFKNINLLVCTANLGNAPPDADSWNAWIPKDGKLVPTTQFPVRMNPPPPPPSMQKKPIQGQQAPGSPKRKGQKPVKTNSGDLSGSQPKPQKPTRRGKVKDPPDSRPANTTLRKVKKGKSNDGLLPQQDPYEAYLESLKDTSASFDADDKNATEMQRPKTPKEAKMTWQREKGRPPQIQTIDGEKRRPPRRSRSSQSGADESLASSKKSEGERPQTPKGEPRRGVRRSRSNNINKDPTTPRQRKPRSKSIDASKMDENRMSPSHNNKSPRTPNGMLRRVSRSKSGASESNAPQTPNLASPRPRNSVGRRKSFDVATVEAIGSSSPGPGVRRKSLDSATTGEVKKSPKPGIRRGRMRSKSPMGPVSSRSKSPLRRVIARARSRSVTRDNTDGNKDRSGKGQSNDAPGTEIPEAHKINQAEISQDEMERIKKFEIRYPVNKANEKSKDPNQHELGCYDIIVIGMQEATFSTSEKKQTQPNQQRTSKTKGSFDDATDDNNSDSDDDSDAESIGSLTDDGDLLPLDRVLEAGDNDDALSDEMKSTKSKTKLKKKDRGKSILKKISKATSKTAKTIDTFAGGGKDHTKRLLRTSPPAVEDEEDESTTLSKADTFSSEDTDDDEDFSLLDESASGKGNVTPKEKKWSDTDVLHHALESNQLPGYTRALSYQFGQMRLFVYYKAGKANSDLLQSLDVLSVGYHATGKAGLANKGGILAEVAVNKTTKLSFMTAHLEAHEGAKHYKARNDSLQDILMETSNSKFFDASQSSHFTFAMGDLNYRTKLTDVAVGSDRHIQFSHNIVERRDWRILNQYDELTKTLSKKLVLSGFKTAYCNFPPTFKVDRQHGYLYNPKRSPSYTDRILFKNSDRLDAATKLLLYEPIEGFTSSDHKPIRSGFSIRLNRELRWKSTAELLLAAEDKNNSLDDLDEIIPNTSKGNIDADRETMHFFITNIECVINPSNYDQIRRQDKAELPNPKLLFLANPSEAVVLHDYSGKKRRFGLGGLGKALKDNPNPSESTKKTKDSKYPSTPSSKETMRPIWKDEHVYFALQTHTEHGRPIDFTGAQLHFSLVDTKNGNSVIGAHCLNLAHLLIRSREKPAREKPKGMTRSTSHQNVSEQKRMERMNSKKRMNSNSNSNSGSSRRLGNERSGSSRRLNGSSRRLGDERPTSQRRVNKKEDKGGKPTKRGGTNPNLASGYCYQLVPKPSPAMRAAAANALRLGSNSTTTTTTTTTSDAKQLPPAVKRAAEAIHRVESGASKLYESIMADLGGGIGKALSQNNKAQDEFEFGHRSLRLQETLIEGGLVTGHIKCDIDVWWT